MYPPAGLEAEHEAVCGARAPRQQGTGVPTPALSEHRIPYFPQPVRTPRAKLRYSYEPLTPPCPIGVTSAGVIPMSSLLTVIDVYLGFRSWIRSGSDG